MRSERERRAITTILDHAVPARTWISDLDERAFAEDRKTFYAMTAVSRSSPKPVAFSRPRRANAIRISPGGS